MKGTVDLPINVALPRKTVFYKGPLGVRTRMWETLRGWLLYNSMFQFQKILITLIIKDKEISILILSLFLMIFVGDICNINSICILFFFLFSFFLFLGLCHSSQQCWILNLLIEARDRTSNLVCSGRIGYHWATTGTPAFAFYYITIIPPLF